jgi:hypothetical protein
MPIRRFRSVEDMSRERWRAPGDPELYRAIARLWTFGRRSRALRFTPGVYRSRSIQELNERSDLWSRANIQALIDARARR